MFFGLPFLPVHEVTDAFIDLMSICPQDACSEFGDYILNTYIEGQFPMEIWTHPINANITKLQRLRIELKDFTKG